MSARTLRAEAREACEGRGHNMRRFFCVGRSYRTKKWNWWRSRCRDCGAEVDVMCNPQPNQTNIAGEAVAIDCESAPAWLRCSHMHVGPFAGPAEADEFRRRTGVAGATVLYPSHDGLPTYSPEEWL